LYEPYSKLQMYIHASGEHIRSRITVLPKGESVKWRGSQNKLRRWAENVGVRGNHRRVTSAKITSKKWNSDDRYPCDNLV